MRAASRGRVAAEGSDGVLGVLACRPRAGGEAGRSGTVLLMNDGIVRSVPSTGSAFTRCAAGAAHSAPAAVTAGRIAATLNEPVERFSHLPATTPVARTDDAAGAETRRPSTTHQPAERAVRHRGASACVSSCECRKRGEIRRRLRCAPQSAASPQSVVAHQHYAPLVAQHLGGQRWSAGGVQRRRRSIDTATSPPPCP